MLVCLLDFSYVSFCQWFSQNLATVGLAISFSGTVLMSGTRLPGARKLGFWLFPEYQKRAEGYQTLIQNGEILPGEDGFSELRTALFPTDEDKIFPSQDDVDAQDLFSDEGVEPVKIKKEDFALERIDDRDFPPTRAKQPGGIVNPKDIVTISQLHYIADEWPNAPNLDGYRELCRSYDDVDETLESKFEDAMLYFGLQVLGFGFILQLIAASGMI